MNASAAHTAPRPRTLKIALLGAESTGKSTLAADMALQLQRRGLRVAAVPELLRSWCETHRREPRPDELLAIGQAQETQADEAAGQHDIVLADTTALLVAVYGGRMLPDDPLLSMALARQRTYDLTLLMGLDLPWRPDGLFRQDAASREPVDALLRQQLAGAGVAFKLVYGTGGERRDNALQAVAEVAPWAWPLEEAPVARWTAVCENCDDPGCEHGLFRRLRAG